MPNWPLKYSLYRYIGPKVYTFGVHGPLGLGVGGCICEGPLRNKIASSSSEPSCFEDGVDIWGLG